VTAPIGADAVMPEPSDRLAGLRLARLRVAARGRLEVRGSPVVERGVRIVVARGGRVVLEDGCLLGAGCRIDAVGGIVRVGSGARIGARAVIVAHERVELGAGCVIGEWALVCDAEPTYADPERPTRLQPIRISAVRVGEGARVGAHATIHAGAKVRPAALVGSYASVGPS
jgi:acetyltransferase-like isoleucine patch superfamily enzyme